MKNNGKPVSKKKTALLCVGILLLLLMFALDSRLLVRTYEIEDEQIHAPVRIALITDLHSCRYGNSQSNLIKAVHQQDPDLIFLVGDIFDDILEDTNTKFFIEEITKQYPCYYVTGNHEYWAGKERFDKQMEILHNNGVHVLSGRTEVQNISGVKLRICGINDPEVYKVDVNMEDNPQEYFRRELNRENDFIRQLEQVSESASATEYTILLSHRPEYFEIYRKYPFDLVLCGHAHGGQWRIPFLLNGVYAPHQGLFPKYAGGLYKAENMRMIVSRGLARETTYIPRIFNRPELVIIDLK